MQTSRRMFEICLENLAGMFLYLHNNHISFDFYSADSDWQCMHHDGISNDLLELLTGLAHASYKSIHSMDVVNEILDISDGYHNRYIVLGANAKAGWMTSLPDDKRILMMDANMCRLSKRQPVHGLL